ncbi:hypothetical protein MAMP_00896 [Methylophaga aminisulfidivorans MP]|uniref:Uncharacterized protein n=1 Tax=Methylophaga aminisulfidivorans MP TaxID=1026882 RepID=F5T2Z9_9GAMM|nr:hypothetical protein MAMP_00896 [Methylophaga aminisulfidivorans MP]
MGKPLLIIDCVMADLIDYTLNASIYPSNPNVTSDFLMCLA